MKNDANLSAHRFLIIAGTSKAGTTSVFNYLAGHPQICPAEKETRFFLDADYPLPSKRRYQENSPETYLSLFEFGPPENWRFEATPDYLYSANTPHVIHRALANVRLIFILREPVSRLLSWYRFARKRSEIPVNMTFDDYIAVQRKNSDNFGCRGGHPALYALQHGRYSLYLRPYFEVFGESSIHVMFYEELRREPLAFIKSICRSIGIDESYFRDYRFDIINKGSDVRSPYFHKAYVGGMQRVGQLVRYAPQLRLLLRQIGRKVDATYEKLNVTRNAKVTISCSTKDFISAYYREEPERLKEMLGFEVPWTSTRPPAVAGIEASS